MPSQTKPNVNIVWAENGTATPYPDAKQRLGFVEEIPYWDDFNGLIQQITQFLKHVNQEGVALWDAVTVYPVGGYAKWTDGNTYRALEEHSGTQPVTGGVVSSRWVRITYTLPELQTDVTAVFVGQVASFAAAPSNPNWLLCDGRAVSRTTYARLFALIGTTYGAGNNTTTFNLPELRGEVVRGLDNGRGVDSGRALGSAQTDAIANHSHNLRTSTDTPGTDWVIPDSVFRQTLANPEPTPGQVAKTYPSGPDGTYAGETRMRNVALPYYIFS